MFMILLKKGCSMGERGKCGSVDVAHTPTYSVPIIPFRVFWGIIYLL